MSKFHFGPSPNDSSSEDDDLPFPAPLSRDAFSANIDGQFSPTAFLGTLRNRHQTLEDLRAELRTRSKDLERELVELVNHNYADFVGLGSSVKGGETKVEDLKVGLLGFRREVAGIKVRIEEMQLMVGKELEARGKIQRQKTLARNLLSLSRRLDELSSLLLLGNAASEGSEALPPLYQDDGEGLTSLPRLRKLVTSWAYLVRHLIPKIPPGHPFLAAQQGRMKKVKETLLIDLVSGLKDAKVVGDEERVLEMLGLFGDLNAETEAVKALRELKR